MYIMAFRFTDFDALGFDVDHTLVHYKLDHLYPLVYHCLAKALVDLEDYPKILIEEPLNKYPGFCSRGVIFDSHKGNFVKLSKDGKIVRASHGTKVMSEEEIKHEYGKEKKWEAFEEFMNEKPSVLFRNPNFPMSENFFDMPAMLLCARLVDLMDDEKAGKEKYRLIWPDVLAALIANFDFRLFAVNQGNFWPVLKADIHKYVHKVSDQVKEWLCNLRKSGIKLFLITNSQADFSMFVLEAAFGKDWLSYFDVAISRAGKPGFFENQHHFLEVVNGVAANVEIRDLEEGKYYSEGNSTDLQRFLSKIVNKPPKDVKVLFFGDSFKSDVYAPKFFADWQTVALLEEMALEVELLAHSRNSQDQEKNEFEINNEEPTPKKRKENTSTLPGNGPSNATRGVLHSPVWGSVFYLNGQLMETFYGSIVDEHSSLIIPGLDYLTEVDVGYDFARSRNCSTRFHPQIPEIRTQNTTVVNC